MSRLPGAAASSASRGPIKPYSVLCKKMPHDSDCAAMSPLRLRGLVLALANLEAPELGAVLHALAHKLGELG